MPLCHSPWTNLDISPLGDMAPCCKFLTKLYPAQYNIKHHTIQEYKDSSFVKDIKQQMHKGEWPRGCDRCRIEEQNHIASKRQLDRDRWHQYYDNYDLENGTFITASIAFGNTCNLKCITCGPYSSSKWQKEYFDITGINVQAVDFYRQDFIDTFIHNTPEIVHIDIPGGEPFLSGVRQQQEMLSSYVQSGQSHNISLHYTTNGTIFPDDSWWTVWENFKEIDLQISIDGIGDRFEYIRFPANWNLFLANLNRYQAASQSYNNFRLSVSHTVSAYNIFYLDEFFTWCHNADLPEPWLGRVHRPEHMRPTVWPIMVRQVIADLLRQSNFSKVKQWADLMLHEDDSMYFEKFQEVLHKHDSYRKLDFKKTFPEMGGFL